MAADADAPAVDLEATTAALTARKDHILANLDTMTLKSVIALLASDLGVDAAAVKEHKKALKEALEGLIAASVAQAADAAPAASPAKPAKQPTPVKKKAAASPDGDDASEAPSEAPSDASTPPRKKAKAAAAAAPKPKASGGGGGGRRQLTALAEKLRAVARAAGIAVPPALYARSKSNADVEAGFAALLARYDLDGDADGGAIRAAKARVKRERELDGIDTANVIDDDGGSGRSGRRTRGARVDYSKVLAAPKLDSEDEGETSSEEDEEDDDESDASLSGSDGDASPTPKKKAPRSGSGGSGGGKKGRGKSSSPEEEEEEEEDEEEEEASDGESE